MSAGLKCDAASGRDKRKVVSIGVLRPEKVLAISILVAVALTSCRAGGGAGGRGTVGVTLQEWAVIPAETSVQAGSVTFEVQNEGPDHPHELMIIKTDLAPDSLPITHDGAVDEEGQGIDIIGEIEEFAAGETRNATFDLDPGNYALVCNVTGEEGGEHGSGGEVHYKMGMRAAFSVE